MRTRMRITSNYASKTWCCSNGLWSGHTRWSYWIPLRLARRDVSPKTKCLPRRNLGIASGS
ncbi:hypothetical protein RHMOL_Rhmol13G0151800 [Rhododendron molle]|uniref:Uncharacterized protein n=1 Tax=Rhododendron molle TaxID=49168 RepID=A0ACC0L6X6_RHOML|nr:hypothetical protein RHMOL_Rhmol13G0151800 [Rhododendron molle]